MTQPLNEIIESKAKDLFEFMNDPLLWEAADQDKKIKNSFIKLGRYVLASEIKARIEELTSTCTLRQPCSRLLELEEQLKEIENAQSA